MSASTRPPPYSWCLVILTGSHHSWSSANSIKKTCQLHCLWSQRSSCAWEHQWQQEKSDLRTTVATTLKVVDAAPFPNITSESTSYPGHHPRDLLWMWEGSLKSATPENIHAQHHAGDRLTGLAMMHVRYTREIHLDTIIQNFRHSTPTQNGHVQFAGWLNRPNCIHDITALALVPRYSGHSD